MPRSLALATKRECCSDCQAEYFGGGFSGGGSAAALSRAKSTPRQRQRSPARNRPRIPGAAKGGKVRSLPGGGSLRPAGFCRALRRLPPRHLLPRLGETGDELLALADPRSERARRLDPARRYEHVTSQWLARE